MASKEELLAKAQDAVEKGILTQDNYQTAIQATRDNPDLIEYFSSVFPESTEAVETTQLPPRYEFEGTEVSKELFEELSRETDPGFIGDLDPSDESVPFEEEVEELVFAPTDKPVEDLVFAPTDKPVEDLVFAPTDKPMTIGEQNVAALNNTVDLTDPSMLEFNDQAQKNEDTTWNLALTRFTPEQIEEMKDNPIGWSEANDFITPSDYLPGGGLVRGYEALGLAGIAKKIQDKVPLTESEETRFNDYIDTELEKQIRGFTWRGGMKYYGAPMPAFIAEFAATGGVGKTAQTAATQALTKGVMVTAQAAAAARYTGYGARVAAQSTAMVPANVANYGDLRLGQFVQLTQSGQAILSDAKESPAVTALKAFAYTNAEIASELVGAKVGQYVLNPITRRLATNAKTSLDKLPPALIEGITKAYQKIQPNAKVQEILTRAGWHGVLNELGEERVAAVLNTYVDMAFGDTFTVDEVWDRIVPDKDQFLIEAGLIATMGGVKTVGVAFSNILSNQGRTEQEIMEALEGLTDEELQNVVDEQTNVEENAPVSVVLKEDRVGDYTNDQQRTEDQSMLEWMQSSMYNREVEDMSNKQEILQEIEDSELPSYETKREALIAGLIKDIEDIEKAAPKLLNFVLEGGPLNPDQLIGYGLDPANFNRYDQIGRTIGTKRAPQGRGTSKGKGVKRLWSRNNPTQTISDLTERLNEELALIDNNIATDKSRLLSDNDVAEMIIEWIDAGDDSIKGTFFDPSVDLQIEERQRYIDELNRLDGEEDIRAYFDTIYQEVSEYNESEVPVETEATLAGEDIEYAESIDQAEFHEHMAEVEKFLIEQETAEKAEMYDIPEGELLAQFVDQPELVDDAPPMIDHSQSLFASFYAAFVNKFDAVEKALKLAKSRGAAVLDGANTELLISAYSGIIGNIKYTLQRNTYSMDENGNMVKSGIGLKPILEAFDAKLFGVEPSKAKRKADLAKFLIAKRIQQDLQNYTIPGVRDEAPKVDAETQAGQEGLTQNAINDLSIELQNKYDLSAAEVVVKEVDGNLFIELDGKITQDTLNDIYEFADQNNVDLKLHVNVDAFVDGKKIADGTIPGSDTFINPKGEFVYGLQRSPIASTRAPELAGPTQPQPTVVQPDFAKDKKFVGPVTERRVSEEQALQAEIDLADLAFKYGDAIEFFDSTSQELYGFQKRVLQLFVKSGNMSQEQYNEIVNANQNYIPFQRVMLNDFLKNKGFNQDQVRRVLGVLSDDEIQQVIDEEKISQEQYDRIITDDPGAVEILKPLMQPSKGGKDLFSGASAKAVVKRLRGSDLAIKDPINSIIGNTSRIIDLSSRNNIARSLVNLRDYIPEFIQEIPQQMQEVTIDGEKVLVPSNRPPADAVEVFIDGKRKYFEVSDPILKAMQGMKPEQLSFGERLFKQAAALPTTVFRVGATMTPEFILKNTFRDQFNAALMSEARPTPIDMVKGLASLVDDGESYNQWKASGGSMGTYMDLSDTGLYDAHKDLMDETKYSMKMLRTFGLQPLADFASATEQATRIGIYTASKRAGMSDLKAAQESRQGTADFMRSGSVGKSINRYVPFFNAAVQGTDKLIRAFKKNPKQVSAIAAMTITMPSVLLAGYYLYGAPDDEREEYLNIPQWVRDSHWVYKVGGKWMRVPKPFAPGYIFGTLPEKFMTWSHQNNNPVGKSIYEEVLAGMWVSASPVSDATGLLPPPAKIGLEIATNWNFYRGQSIYPDYLDDLEPELRASPYTSETARVLGEKFNVSPANVDALLKGTFASSSKYITGAGDLILGKVREFNDQPYSARPTSDMDIPVLGSFLVRPPVSGSSITGNTFYDLSQEVKIKSNSLKSYSGEKAKNYRRENQFMFSQEGQVKRAAKKIAKLNKKRRQVRGDMRMSADQKAKRLEQLDRQVYERAKQSVEQYLKGLEKYEKSQ
jgi:hypothetical protein